tara:strand:+ start:870 stop:1616 length:747 start_codon:yes stop_codon:yes gene_type:complete
MVTVDQLEQIALQSQQDPEYNDIECIHTLEFYESELGIVFSHYIEALRKVFGQELITSNLNGHRGKVAGQLELYDGVSSFATGGDFFLSTRSGLPLERFIQADTRSSESMKKIPDESFHFVYCCRGLELDNTAERVIPEIYRMLCWNGLAVFDFEMLPVQAFKSLRLPSEILDSLYVVGRNCAERYSTRDFCEMYLEHDTYIRLEVAGETSELDQSLNVRAFKRFLRSNPRFEIFKSNGSIENPYLYV